jgi:hypothetical protein
MYGIVVQTQTHTANSSNSPASAPLFVGTTLKYAADGNVETNLPVGQNTEIDYTSLSCVALQMEQ